MMWLTTLVVVLLIALVVVLAVVAGSAILLALGTLLARVFAVTVFEATLVALAVAAAILFFFSRVSPVEETGVEEPEEEIEVEPPIIFGPLPLPPMRRGKKRRR